MSRLSQSTASSQMQNGQREATVPSVSTGECRLYTSTVLRRAESQSLPSEASSPVERGGCVPTKRDFGHSHGHRGHKAHSRSTAPIWGPWGTFPKEVT